jgi:hypothetical protein
MLTSVDSKHTRVDSDAILIDGFYINKEARG